MMKHAGFLFTAIAIILILANITAAARKVSATDNRKAAKGSVRAVLEQYHHNQNNIPSKGAKTPKRTGCVRFQNKFSAPSEIAKEIGRKATMFAAVIHSIKQQTNMTISEIAESVEILDEIRKLMPALCGVTEIACVEEAIYRTADGSCNNLGNATWGMAMTRQARFLPSQYDDGMESPRKVSVTKTVNLPSPRKVSNIVHRQKSVSVDHPYFNVMVMQWGQFIAHEFVSTPVFTDSGEPISCCGKPSRPECLTIDIPSTDDQFTHSCMHFVRSLPAEFKDCIPTPREHINQITSYIDGSGVYGSSLEEQKLLRTWKAGLLETGRDNLLPPSQKDNCIKEADSDYCQLAGDRRPDVVPSLGTSHTIFMRQHNNVAMKLQEINPDWGDERLFQEARKIVSAIMQHITYNEYLPIILNSKYMAQYDLSSKRGGFHTSYDENVDASIRNSFGVAAFRFGHSEIPNIQGQIKRDWYTKTSKLIEETYNRPNMVQADNGEGESGVADIARWLLTEKTPDTDRFMDIGVRDLLFRDEDGVSLDLAALNMQRGRDHAIPPYNAWRKFCGLKEASHFGTSGGGLVDHTAEVAKLFQMAYSDPGDIDLFSGGISEKHISEGHVGPTFACLIAKQFHALKHGDRFFYENEFKGTGFTKDQLKEIKKITLSKVLCDNLNMFSIQPNSFFVPEKSNERVLCDSIPGIDICEWDDSNSEACRKKKRKSRR